MLFTLYFIILILLYPVLTGPLAALIYLRILLYRAGKRVILFWLGLLVVHGLGFIFLTAITGDNLFDPGFFSCLITPLLAVLSALVLRFGGLRMAEEPAWGLQDKRWLLLGTVIIPLLQLITMGSFVVLAPYLCQIGLRSCWPG